MRLKPHACFTRAQQHPVSTKSIVALPDPGLPGWHRLISVLQAQQRGSHQEQQ
jgi:hypothetical protein